MHISKGPDLIKVLTRTAQFIKIYSKFQKLQSFDKGQIFGLYLVQLYNCSFLLFCSPGTRRKDEAGVQVPRRLRLLHHQDLLDYTSQVPRDWLRTQGQVQRSRACGGSPG